MTTSQPNDPYRFLAIAIIHQAARDARRGDSSARAWLQETGQTWIDLAGLPISPAAWARWVRAGCPNMRRRGPTQAAKNG